jgi:hypothetical protein
MKKLLLALVIATGGLLGFGALRRSAERTEIVTTSISAAWQAATNDLATLIGDATSLRGSVADKKGRLKQRTSWGLYWSKIRPQTCVSQWPDL